MLHAIAAMSELLQLPTAHPPPLVHNQVLSLVLAAGVAGGAAYGIARVDARLLGAGEETLDGVQVGHK